jgi:hypothetical protein
MSDVLQVLVDCIRDGKIIASYQLGIPGSLIFDPVIDRPKLEYEAKGNLSNDRLAFPPYAGITFNIRKVGRTL